MNESKHFGLVGGLGVGATVIYYEAIAAACAERGIVPRLTMAHANAPTALACVQSGRIDDLAAYLAGFVQELAAAGATFFAIPAITPHICLAELKRRVSLPIVDILEVTADRVRERRLSRVALFGTRYTIDSRLFGALDASTSSARRTRGRRDPPHLSGAGDPRADLGRRTRRGCGDLAQTLCRRDRVEAIILAGTDLNLIFSEADAGFPRRRSRRPHRRHRRADVRADAHAIFRTAVAAQQCDAHHTAASG